MYATGQGVPENNAEAVKWYRKAAERGDADAQFALGFIYAKGLGVPQDYAEAIKWTRKAADQGQALAQYNLGVAYSNGQGVPQDYVQSYYWYSLAASRSAGDDHKKFSASINAAAKKLNPEKLLEAQRMTMEWEKSHPRK